MSSLLCVFAVGDHFCSQFNFVLCRIARSLALRAMVHIEEFPPLPETPSEASARLQATILHQAGSRLEAAASKAEGNSAALIEASVRLQVAVVAAQAEVSDDDRRLADARFALGDALVNQEKDLLGGAAEFCQALAANPWHADAMCGLGTALGELGDLDGAIEAFRRAIGVAPRHGQAHFYLGSALGRQGDLYGAADEWKAVIEYDPKSPAAELAKANLEAIAQA